MNSMQFLRRDRSWQNQPYGLALLITSAFALMASVFLMFQLGTVQRVQAVGIDYPYPSTANDATLSIQLTADVTTATMGSYIHYTMTVANLTTVTTTKTFAFTELPTQTTFITGNVTVQAIAQITGALQAGNYYDPQYHSIAWVGTLAPQSSSTLFFTVKVKETAACDEPLQTKSPWLPEALTIPLLCADRPQLYLSYTSNVTSTTFHGIVQYEVLIRNTGLVAATDLILRTLLPAPNVTRYLSNTLILSGGNASFLTASNTLLWTGGVPAQGSVRITYAIQVTAVACNMLGSDTLLEGPSPIERLYASAGTIVNCPHINPLQLELRSSSTETIPGGMIAYQLLVTNTSDLPTDEFHILNFIPLGATYMAGSATATVGAFTNMPIPKELTWTGALPEHSTATLHFQIRLRERISCGMVMNLLAIVYDLDYMQPSDAGRESPIIATCTTTQPWSDFGNAPDSDSNHHGMNNTAYPEIGGLGHFPTVWEGTPANEASGPTHYTGAFWLGGEVDAEVDADLNFNNSGLYDYSNILHNGEKDITYWDEQDSWVNMHVPMLNCETTTLVVYVSRGSLPAEVKHLWLNAWFDGNRDGDWQDSGLCPNDTIHRNKSSFEWFVQDWAIDPNQIPVGGKLELQVPTELIYNPMPTMTTWLRLSLSEQPAVRPIPGGLADGRGPAYPDLFQVGETEDYWVDGLPGGEPISVAVSHDLEGETTEAVRIGGKISGHIFFTPETGVAPVTIVLSNNLPAEVTVLTPPEFFYTNEISPLTVTFQPNEGPSGRIEWRGQLGREAIAEIVYTAEVNACPPPDSNGQPTLRSVIEVRQPDGTLTHVLATYPVVCTYPPHSFLPLIAK